MNNLPTTNARKPIKCSKDADFRIDDNKNTCQANILCCLTTEEIQKHIFFVENICDLQPRPIPVPTPAIQRSMGFGRRGQGPGI